MNITKVIQEFTIIFIISPILIRTNFFNNPSKDWSLIDSLSFRVRNENFFNAWYFGSGLPSIVVEAINKGLIDNISILPGMVEVSHE